MSGRADTLLAAGSSLLDAPIRPLYPWCGSCRLLAPSTFCHGIVSESQHCWSVGEQTCRFSGDGVMDRLSGADGEQVLDGVVCGVTQGWCLLVPTPRAVLPRR